MGTPDFAVPTLQALAAARHEVAAVYSQPPRPAGRGQKARPSPVQARSEEHTSELQSLTRISYAVFCLKKKTTQTTKRSQILLPASSAPTMTDVCCRCNSLC